MLWCALAMALVAAAEPDPGSETAIPVGPTVFVQPGTAKPGDPVLVIVTGAKAQPTGKMAGRTLHFYRWGDRHEAISALPVEHALGTFPVTVKVAARRGAPAYQLEAS